MLVFSRITPSIRSISGGTTHNTKSTTMSFISQRNFGTKTSRCVGIIGTGNLGQSLASMLLNHTDNSVICSVRRPQREMELRTILTGDNVKFTRNNFEVAQEADCILLSVKPGQIKHVCSEISETLTPGTPVISVAAAVPLVKLHEWLPRTEKIIRCMPSSTIFKYQRRLESNEGTLFT